MGMASVVPDSGNPASERNPSRILFVDDESYILNSIQRLFRKEHLDISCTTSVTEALDRVSKECFAVVVSDHRMPEMEGTLFLEKVREISPGTLRVLLTGYADFHATSEASNVGLVSHFLSKPWNDEELKQVIRSSVAEYVSQEESRRLNCPGETG
jgi:DNA-binding NtrC family response regulator